VTAPENFRVSGRGSRWRFNRRRPSSSRSERHNGSAQCSPPTWAKLHGCVAPMPASSAPRRLSSRRRGCRREHASKSCIAQPRRSYMTPNQLGTTRAARHRPDANQHGVGSALDRCGAGHARPTGRPQAAGEAWPRSAAAAYNRQLDSLSRRERVMPTRDRARDGERSQRSGLRHGPVASTCSSRDVPPAMQQARRSNGCSRARPAPLGTAATAPEARRVAAEDSGRRGLASHVWGQRLRQFC